MTFSSFNAALAFFSLRWRCSRVLGVGRYLIDVASVNAMLVAFELDSACPVA